MAAGATIAGARSIAGTGGSACFLEAQVLPVAVAGHAGGSFEIGDALVGMTGGVDVS